MIEEDKVSLTRKRVELVESLTSLLPPEERVRVQGEISVLNAKIKALNTTSAAQLKAAADRRKVAGLVEAQANAARARARVNGMGAPEEAEDDDLGQEIIIDGWIDAVLLRHYVIFAREKGVLRLDNYLYDDPKKLVAVIALLVNGIYAVARGEVLPDLPSIAPPQKAPLKPQKAPSPPKQKRS